MKIKYKYTSIEAFAPWEEDWNPEVLEYWKKGKALPKSQLPLSERIRETIHILKKNGIHEFYSPRCGAMGYYYSYAGFAIQLSKVTVNLLKQLAPLATYIDLGRIANHRYPGAVMQIVFRYSLEISEEACSICEPDYSKHPYNFPSWMKKVKWYEKLNAIEV